VRTREIKQKIFVSADHRQHCLTAVLFAIISDVRTSLKQNTETVLVMFKPHYSRVEKYATEAETVSVSVFYFSFISPCATGFIDGQTDKRA